MIAIGFLLYMSNSASRPGNLGADGGRLAPCPDSPNCVSSQADPEDSHYIEPMAYIDGASDQTYEAVAEYLLDLPRTNIVTKQKTYLHVECTSMIFRFVDDLEIVFDHEAQLVHFRSASRVGHSDLGANRRRVEKLKKAVTGG